MKHSISPLLGQQIDAMLSDKICDLLLSHQSVLGIHDLLFHDYGPGQCYASVHVELSADAPALESHDVIDGLEREALQKLNVHLVIHCDPV